MMEICWEDLTQAQKFSLLYVNCNTYKKTAKSLAYLLTTLDLEVYYLGHVYWHFSERKNFNFNFES